MRYLEEQSEGAFWVGTAGDGLHTMDGRTGKFERHRYDPPIPGKLSRPAVSTYNIDYITFIKEDALQNMWIGTVANGVNRYDPKTKLNTHYGTTNNEVVLLKIAHGAFPILLMKYWVGTFEGGLYRADPYRNTISHILNGSRVNAFDLDSSNNLWIGTANGLIFQDGKTGRLKKLLHEDNNPGSLSDNVINSLYRDEEGILW